MDIPSDAPSEIFVLIGDILRSRASGVVVVSGRCVQVFGVFADAVVGVDGRVYAPEGPPTSVLLRAVEAGAAELETRTATDPWQAPEVRRIRVVVGS